MKKAKRNRITLDRDMKRGQLRELAGGQPYGIIDQQRRTAPGLVRVEDCYYSESGFRLLYGNEAVIFVIDRQYRPEDYDSV